MRSNRGVTTGRSYSTEIKSGWARKTNDFASREYFEKRISACCKMCTAAEKPRMKRYPATAISASELSFDFRWGYNGAEAVRSNGSQSYGPQREDMEEGSAAGAGSNRPKKLLQRTLLRDDKRWLRNAHNQCTHYQPDGVDAALVHSLMCRPVGLLL